MNSKDLFLTKQKKMNGKIQVYCDAPGGLRAPNSCWMLTPEASSDFLKLETATWIMFDALLCNSVTQDFVNQSD